MRYFEQETDYTCGVACLRMVISHFDDNVPTEAVLIPLLETNDRIGTKPCHIIKVAKDLGYEVIEGEKGTIELLDEFRDKGYIVMMMVSVDVPHWVIYNGNNNNHAFFFDPYFGENQAHQLKHVRSDKRRFPFFRWRLKNSEFTPLLKTFSEYDFSALESEQYYLAFKK